MDWVAESKKVFAAEKPEHFTDYLHCEECAEHDETLLNATIEGIGLNELGNPGWDPICFCSDDGKRYLMPAFIRLSLETVNGHFYLSQFLFHLELDGPENNLVVSCSAPQRKFIADFVAHMIDTYPDQIEKNYDTEKAFNVHKIWSNA